MELEIRELNDEEVEYIEDRLDDFNKDYIRYELQGRIRIGAFHGDRLIAGVDASMTAFKILYLSTFFVEEEYRSRGIGRKLMDVVERQAKALGANMIRLDTFDWQGKHFYRSMDFEEVGSYTNEVDGFSEHFFLKRLY